MRLAPYIALMRLDKPVGIWLVFFPAAWGVALASCHETGLRWAEFFACFVGAVLVRSAGCVLNDLADRTLDRHVARTASRPLAAGTVSVQAALLLAAVLLLLALGVALMLPPTVLIIACLAMPMIAAYPFMKRITWWPQAFLGLTFNLGALMGWAAVRDTVDAAAWWLYAGSVLWTFGYDTLYAHQDREDDAKIGIKSSARALGQHTVWVVGLAYAGFMACLTMGFALAGAYWPAFMGITVASMHLCWQLWRFDLADAAGAGRLFRSNSRVGLVILAALLASNLSIAFLS